MGFLPSNSALQTTEQSHTGDTNWTDIPGAVASGLSAGKKYLCILFAEVRGSNTGTNFGIRAATENGPIEHSEWCWEPEAPVSYNTYSWAKVITGASGDSNLKLQFKTYDPAQTVYAYTASCIWLLLSDDLVENLLWYYNEDINQTGLGASWSSLNNASLTIEQSDVSHDWLVFSWTEIIQTAIDKSAFTRLNLDSGSNVYPELAQRGEDVPLDVFQHSIMRVYKGLSVGQHTITVQSKAETGAGSLRKGSGLFALNLSRCFKAAAGAYTEAKLELGHAPAWDELQGVGATPLTAGYGLCMGWWGTYQTFKTGYKIRQQLNGVDTPPVSDYGHYYPWDVTDMLPVFLAARPNLTASIQDFDVDAQTAWAGTYGQYRSAVLLSLELKDDLPEPPVVEVIGEEKIQLHRTFQMKIRLHRNLEQKIPLHLSLEKHVRF